MPKPAMTRLSARQRIELLDQLQVLLASDLPVIEALNVIGRLHPNTEAQRVIHRWRASVQQGHGLAHGFRQLTPAFPETVAAMIEAGEATGTLACALADVVGEQKAREAATKRLVGALAYPATVLVVATLVSLGLLLGVVPQFEALFEGFDAPLPAPTVAIIQAAQALKALGWSDMLVGLSVPLGIIGAHRFSASARSVTQRLLARLPIIGVLLHNQSLLIISQGMATLLRAGLPLAQAVALVGQATGQLGHSQALRSIHRAINQGTPLAEAMGRSGAFPDWMVHLIGIGERNGQLGAMFDQAASMLQSDVNNALDRSLKLVEPIMMVAVGLLVGGLLIGLYLPIFNLSSVMM